MANTMDKLAKELKSQMDASDARKPKPYDAQAEVLRVEDGVAWVHIPGGVEETPVRLTINAKKGDMVNIRVANGSAWITGNSTNPPTDDSTANYAVNISNEVKKDVTILNTVVAEEIEATNARFGNVEADTAKIHNLTADQINATVGYIDDLTADNITANDISAASGYIKDLTADNITASDISADHATVGSLDTNYAQINAANITDLSAQNAWVNKIMVQTGLLAHEGTVFTLDAIQVNAANITAGTIDVNRLIVTVDGEKYLVEIDPTTHQPSYEKLDGNIVEPRTITADKIVAHDITVQEITTENLVGTNGWINLNQGKFFYGDGANFASATNAISWNGSKLQIKADEFLLSTGQTIQDSIESVENWFYSVPPTTSNPPASSWTTTNLKEQHLRDIYFDTTSGKSYRWAKEGTTYKWVEIEDVELAALAKDLHDNYPPRSEFTVAPDQIQAVVTNEANARKAIYGTCSTGGSTAAKSVTCSNFARYTGAVVTVKFANANTATTPTLNINSTGAATIKSYTGAALSEAEYKWAAGATLTFVFDGTYWRLQDSGSTAQIKVNADNINLKVAKNDVINQINVSTEGAQILAEKVDIAGATVFNNYSTTSQMNTAIGNAVDGIEVGGRNILKNSDTSKMLLWSTAQANGGTMTVEENITVSEWRTNEARRVYGKAGSTNNLFGIINEIYASTQLSISDQPYVFSIYIKNQSANAVSVNFNSIGTGVTVASGEIVRVISTNAKGNGSSNVQFTFAAPSASANYDFVYWHPQIEYGTKATEWSPAPEDVQDYTDNAVNSIEVGGKNILVGTGTSISKATTATTSYVTQVLYRTPDLKTLAELGYKVDDALTLSFDWEVTSATTYGNARIEWYGYKSASATDTYLAPLINPFATFSASNTSGHVVATVKLTSTTINSKKLVLRIDNSNLTLTISNLKLEKGNKATDWTPAPEDVQAEIDAKRSVWTLKSSGTGSTYANILTWTAEGRENSSWGIDTTATPLTNVKIGDTCRVAYKVTDMGTADNRPYVYVVGELTNVSGSTIYMTMHGLDTTIIDGGNILTNSIGANQIAANSIGAKHLTISDNTNLATANEIYESSLPPYSQPSAIENGYLVKKVATQTYLMVTDFTANSFKTNDELYYEFYGKAATAGAVSLGAWGYDGVPGSTSGTISNLVSINFTTSKTFYSGTIKLANANWDTKSLYILGFTDSRSTKSQIYVKNLIIRRKNGGNLIVDGSITSDHISANKISASKIKVDEINIGAAQITSGTIDTARIPNLSAGKITSGTISIGRIPDDALNSNIWSATNGYTILWNYSDFSTANNGEGYICKLDPATGTKSDANGTVMWNGTVRTVTKQMINPNSIAPFNIPIYVVCRLSSATATTGTNYIVWYNSEWKYATLPTPTAVGGTWTWAEATDIILGKFVEPASETAFTECEIFDPPRSSKQITTDTVTARSANSTASAANTTANKALSQSAWYATCATAAATTAKVATITPTTTAFTLSAGATVNVKFSETNSGAVGSITLNVNSTGAKNIKYINNNAISNIPAVGYIVANVTYQFVYDGTYWVIQNLNYNSDTYNRTRLQNDITAATAITSGRIVCGTASGYKNIAASVTFDMAYPLLYASSAIDAAATGNNNYIEINGVNASNNGTITSGAAKKTLYLKGTISGNTFTISASPFMTTVVPTSQDNVCYIPLGVMYSATNIYFKSSDQIYAYKDGAFGQISLREASAAAKTATTYITHIDNNGIRVHPSSTQNNSVVINANGMEVFKGGTAAANSVAFYGDTARIGKDASGASRTTIAPSGMQILRKVGTTDTVLANIGYGSGSSESGTADAPYYSFGTRTGSVGNYSFSTGQSNTASGYNSFAGGEKCEASYSESFVYGYRLVTNQAFQAVFGHDNDPNIEGEFIIGNGIGDNSKGNSMTLSLGDLYLHGSDVRIRCRSPYLSTNGVSIAKPEELFSSSRVSITNASYEYKVIRLGWTAMLIFRGTRSTATAAGANVFDVGLNAAVPIPMLNYATSATHFGSNALSGWAYNGGDGKTHVRIRNASTASLAGFSDDLIITFTYFFDPQYY